MNPRTASGGGTWRRHAATVLVVQKAFPVISYCFGTLFVILILFNIPFCLVLNFYNLYFVNMDVKKSVVKVNMCVWIFYLFMDVFL